jgi:hypothetical protein
MDTIRVGPSDAFFKLAEKMQRDAEDVVNRLHRHCRIGRVTKKVMVHGGKMVVPRKWLPDPMKPAPTPFFSGGYVHTSRADAVPA